MDTLDDLMHHTNKTWIVWDIAVLSTFCCMAPSDVSSHIADGYAGMKVMKTHFRVAVF